MFVNNRVVSRVCRSFVERGSAKSRWNRLAPTVYKACADGRRGELRLPPLRQEGGCPHKAGGSESRGGNSLSDSSYVVISMSELKPLSVSATRAVRCSHLDFIRRVCHWQTDRAGRQRDSLLPPCVLKLGLHFWTHFFFLNVCLNPKIKGYISPNMKMPSLSSHLHVDWKSGEVHVSH